MVASVVGLITAAMSVCEEAGLPFEPWLDEARLRREADRLRVAGNHQGAASVLALPALARARSALGTVAAMDDLASLAIQDVGLALQCVDRARRVLGESIDATGTERGAESEAQASESSERGLDEWAP